MYSGFNYLIPYTNDKINIPLMVKNRLILMNFSKWKPNNL